MARPRGLSLRNRILLLVAGVAFGLLALAGLVIRQADASARSWAEGEMLATARALAQMLDGKFAAGEALLHGLAASPALLAGDLATFSAEMTAAAAASGLGNLLLATADGEMVQHSLLGRGHPMPAGMRPNGAVARVLATGRPQTSDLFLGPVSGVPSVAIAIPVYQPDATGRPALRYALGIALRAGDLAQALAAQRLRPGWAAGVVDRSGRMVARSEDHEARVGALVSPPIEAARQLGPDGHIVTGYRIDGMPMVIGIARAAATDFRIALAAPEASFTAPLHAALIGATGAGLALAVAGLLLALVLARQISHGVQWLGALAAGQASPAPAAGSGFSEIDIAARSLRRSVAQREAAEAALLSREAGFRGAFETPLIGLAQADAETGMLLLVNRRFCDILGQEEAALLFRSSLFTLLNPEQAEAQREALRRDGGVSLAAPLLRPDGSTAWVHLSAALIRDPAVQPPRAVVVLEDITVQRNVEQQQSLLARELVHRATNALTVVQAAVRLTPRNDPATFAAAIEARIAALARAHTLLARSGWSGTDLRALLEGELAPFLPADAGAASPAGRASLHGPAMPLLPKAVQPLAMALHELATNSTKYGALSCPEGRVTVQWLIEPATAMLRLCWTEAGGPPVVAPPARRGFGSRLLEATVQSQLGGTVRQSWPRTGLVCTIDLPLERAVAAPPRLHLAERPVA